MNVFRKIKNGNMPFLPLLSVSAVLLVISSCTCNRACSASDEYQSNFISGFHKWHDLFMEDQAFAQNHWLYEKTGDRDASSYLNKIVVWNDMTLSEQTVEEEAELALPSNITEQLQNGCWIDINVDLSSNLDFSWMSKLRKEYDVWHIENEEPVIDWISQCSCDVNVHLLLTPILDTINLLDWVKLRFIRGFYENELLNAVLDVRSLAKLLRSSELYSVEFTAFMIMQFEAQAYHHAIEKGLKTDGWEPTSKEDVSRLRRAWFAAQAYADIEAPEQYATAFDKVVVGRCEALGSAVKIVMTFHPSLQNANHEPISRLDGLLAEETGCRAWYARSLWRYVQKQDKSVFDECNCKESKDTIWDKLLNSKWISKCFTDNMMHTLRKTYWSSYERGMDGRNFREGGESIQ